MTDSNISNQMEHVFFQAKPCLQAHVHSLRMHPQEYIQTLRFLCDSNTRTVVSSAGKARVLSALHMTRQHKTVSFFLEHCEVMDVVEALHLLDRPRKIRQLERRIDKIEKAHSHIAAIKDEKKQDPIETCTTWKVAKRKDSKRSTNEIEDYSPTTNLNKKQRRHRRAVDKFRRVKCTLESEDACMKTCTAAHADCGALELIQSASVSGAFSRKVRQWVKSQRSELLEFVLLAFSFDAWKELADLVHVNPSDFAVPYFLKALYQGDASEMSEHNFVTAMKAFLNTMDCNAEYQERFFTVAEEFPQVYLNYSLIRRYPKLTDTKAIMEQFAASAPLDTVVWHFEAFHRASTHCQDIVLERIQEHGEGDLSMKSKMTYGKLVERILTMRSIDVSFAEQLVPMAQVRLMRLRAFWNSGCSAQKSKVAVFGDASSSLQTAIEATTIFANMVSVCFDGELSLFASDLVESPHVKPNNVHRALEVSTKVRASGATSLAAALWPYYNKEIVMDMFVMVTDEEENTPKNDYNFASLLAAYKKKVNPDVSLVVVCVVQGDWQFRQELPNNGIDYKVVQMDGARPDHAKCDALLGQLALLSLKNDFANDKKVNESADVASKDCDEFVMV
jgi:hypothetical protein